MQKNYMSISAVSSLTGIEKEVLRKWEARYGFPAPERDDKGNRLYTPDQADRLLAIRRLMDKGMRPSQLVPLSLEELNALLANTSPLPEVALQPAMIEKFMACLSANDPKQLHELLQASLVRWGLDRFVLDIMSPLNNLVGDAWADGRIGIRAEHLYSEIIHGLVKQAIFHTTDPHGYPRVLLTTMPGELHTMGLLMVEALFALRNVRCINLGAETPIDEIVLAASDYDVDIVALSFSEAFPVRDSSHLLSNLRSRLPDDIQLWAGGRGTAQIKRLHREIAVIPTLKQGMEKIEEFNKR